MKNNKFNLNYSLFVYRGVIGKLGEVASEVISKQNEINTKTTNLEKKSEKKVETTKKKVDYLKDRDKKENQLIEYWRNDKKLEKTAVLNKAIPDPKSLAAYELHGNLRVMQETRLLLMLIEKYLPGREISGRKLSYKLYQEAREKGKGKPGGIDLDVLRERFIGWPNQSERDKNEDGIITKYGSSAIKELGFYYLPKSRTAVDDSPWTFDEQGIMPAGWYTWDDGEGDYDEWHGEFLSKNLYKVTEKAPVTDLGIAKLGILSRYNDGEGIINEVKGKDSGLDKKRAQDLAADIKKLDLENQDFIRTGVGIKKIRENLFKSLSKMTWGEFKVLSAILISKLNVLFGEKAAKFQYRYVPEQNRIYCLSFNKNENKDAYIEVDKENKTIGEWFEYNGEGDMKGRTIAKDLFKGMSITKFEKEFLDANIKNKKLEFIDPDDKLKQTQGMLSSLKMYKTYKKIEYNRLDNHLVSVKEALMLKLKSKVGDSKAEVLAQLRIDDMKKRIKAKISQDENLQLAVKETPKIKLKLRVNADDTVEVDFASQKLYTKFKKKAEAIRDRGKETMESFTDKKYMDISGHISAKFPGFMGIAVKWILDEVVGLKKGIAKLASGKSAPMTSIVLSMLGIGGIGALKAGWRSREVDQKTFDELLKKQDKERVMKKKIVFRKGVRLNHVKIVIPKGKGIKPGGSLSLVLKNGTRINAAPKQAPKKKGVMGFVAGLKKSSYQFKDEEITLVAGTEIPKDTVIPKGAKIIRV